MKIIYFSAHPHLNLAAPSGPGTHMREVIHAFEHRGHKVIKLIAGGETMKESSPIVFKKSSIKRFIPSYAWQSLKDYKLLRHDEKMYQQLCELIEKEKPDLVYERGYYLISSGYNACRKKGVKHFIELNAPYPEEKVMMEGNSWFVSKAGKVEKEQVLFSDCTITVSSALQSYLSKNSGVDKNKILVTPNAVNPQLFISDDQKRKELQRRYSLSENERVIGFVGSIFPYHGVDVLIQAFVDLLKRRNNIRLLIVGDGEILPQLKREIETLGLSGKVIFTGNVPHREVFSYIDPMDITVMATSNWYGSPVKIFEYGAMKKVIVAPDVVPVHDVMKEGVHGYIVKPDTQGLIAALEKALNDEATSKQMAENFFNKVMNEHTWQHVGDSILLRIA